MLLGINLLIVYILMKHSIFHVDRPIPCSDFGTYAHYGLFEGLLGISIGSVSKDVRYYLDGLLTKFPQYFASTVVDVGSETSIVSSVWQKYNRDLMKWRWKLINRAKVAAGVYTLLLSRLFEFDLC